MNGPPNRTTATGIGVGIGKPDTDSPYESLHTFRYLPNIEANTAYATIFGTLLVIQIGNAFSYKTWAFSALMIGSLVLELVGYIARVLLHYFPFSNEDFVANVYTLSIAPTLTTAAIYIAMGRVINVYGANLARFSPRTYMLIFAGFDQISLVTVGIGGTMASYAKITTTNSLLDPSKNVMLAGLGFQVVSMVIFVAICLDLAKSFISSKHMWNPQYLDLTTSMRFNLFLLSLSGATILILARSAFRVAELSGGFSGKLWTSDEVTFLIMEGGMIATSLLLLTVSHPGYVFGEAWHTASFSLFGSSKNEEQDTRLQISEPIANARLSSGDETEIEKGYGPNDQHSTSFHRPRLLSSSSYRRPRSSSRNKYTQTGYGKYPNAADQQHLQDPYYNPSSPYSHAVKKEEDTNSKYAKVTPLRVTFNMYHNNIQIPKVTRIDDSSYLVGIKGRLDLHDVGS